ncbi:hypothetical protein C8Q74DRAFT_1374122 [Fomes fomentarius]|nr:hypothetical protein C8Q74DRAFT_1374122 [Fomes fomentarius]
MLMLLRSLVLWRFLNLIKHVKAEGADRTVVVQLATFYQLNDSSARGPSAQLDPTFPLKRRSYLVPSRPPPPPPMPSSPGLSAMEQATEELLAELMNAALGAGFLGTELTVPRDMWSDAGSVPPSPSSHFIVTSPASPCPSGLRPPPRSSVPADIILDIRESPVE